MYPDTCAINTPLHHRLPRFGASPSLSFQTHLGRQPLYISHHFSETSTWVFVSALSFCLLHFKAFCLPSFFLVTDSNSRAVHLQIQRTSSCQRHLRNCCGV